MSTIPKTKFGNCSECGAENTYCVKIKKDLVCLDCNTNAKRQQQLSQARLRDKVRDLKEVQDNGMAERQMLMHDLDFLFSRYIRIRESNAKGFTTCYTCDKEAHWSKMQLGHFVKRNETLLRWDARNGKVQCVNCNCLLHGNYDIYTERLEQEHPGLPEQLRQESKEVNKFSREELKELIVDYRYKVKLVESKLEK